MTRVSVCVMTRRRRTLCVGSHVSGRAQDVLTHTSVCEQATRVNHDLNEIVDTGGTARTARTTTRLSRALRAVSAYGHKINGSFGTSAARAGTVSVRTRRGPDPARPGGRGGGMINEERGRAREKGYIHFYLTVLELFSWSCGRASCHLRPICSRR